jgi:hypothetical protein
VIHTARDLKLDIYRKLLKEWHHLGSDGAAPANFPLFQEFFYRAFRGQITCYIIRKTVKQT